MAMTQPDSAPVAPAQMPASTWDIQAPYSQGPSPQPIVFPGAMGPGHADVVAATVDGAVANAKARQVVREAETHPQGSQVGEGVAIPAETVTGYDGGGFYDPPRDYGD